MVLNFNNSEFTLRLLCLEGTNIDIFLLDNAARKLIERA